MNKDNLLKEKIKTFSKKSIGKIYWNEPLSIHSYWKIGGLADILVEPENVIQIQTAIKTLKELEIPNIIIGSGSNLLFDDRGTRGVVIKIGKKLSSYNISGRTVESEAGVFVPKLARQIGCNGLTGLEHIIGIPGTLGGLVSMNGGSLRKSIGENIKEVQIINENGDIKYFRNKQCGFSYRKSIFQQLKCIIVKVILECQKGNAKEIRSEMLRILEIRRKKFPLRMPSCGSVFLSKNEIYEKYGSPGKIIEDVGLKGYRIGDAQISNLHGNFIVNRGNAKCKDIFDIVKYIKETVYKELKITLSCEVRYVHPECSIYQLDKII